MNERQQRTPDIPNLPDPETYFAIVGELDKAFRRPGRTLWDNVDEVSKHMNMSLEDATSYLREAKETRKDTITSDRNNVSGDAFVLGSVIGLLITDRAARPPELMTAVVNGRTMVDELGRRYAGDTPTIEELDALARDGEKVLDEDISHVIDRWADLYMASIAGNAKGIEDARDCFHLGVNTAVALGYTVQERAYEEQEKQAVAWDMLRLDTMPGDLTEGE